MVMTHIRKALGLRAFALLVAATIATLLVAHSADAAPQDYRFESAGAPSKSGKAVLIKVRLVHVPDGKAVAGAIITSTKLDMGPDGMATMTAPGKTTPASEAGIYQVEAAELMGGNWAVTLEARVQGEAQPVRGSLTVAVPK